MISEFPLFAFTLLTGLAGGLYVGAAVFPSKEEKNPRLLPIIVLALVIIGGLAAMAHLGRIGNVFNVLRNPASPLTLEGITAALVAIVAIVDLATCKNGGNRIVRIIGAVLAFAAMFAVGHAYGVSYGVQAWIALPTTPAIILGDASMGIALWLFLTNNTEKTTLIGEAVICALAAIVFAWQAVTFNSLGADGMALIAVGAVLALCAAIVAALQSSGKGTAKTMLLVLAVLAIVAVCVARYGFYMASIL